MDFEEGVCCNITDHPILTPLQFMYIEIYNKILHLSFSETFQHEPNFLGTHEELQNLTLQNLNNCTTHTTCNFTSNR
jgi:hypothetical protein